MSRGLKFRFWKSKIKKMVTTLTGIRFEEGVWNLNENMVIPMQYIGIKDKNNKEIYEGDICHVNEYNTEDKHFDMMGMYGEFGVIEFKEGEYGMLLIDTKRWVALPEEIEIIGNIYETPDLLKQKI